MDQIVLVAYASKYGATGEIARRIGDTLVRGGLQAKVLPADKVKNLAPYGAVILGSAVYAGQWRKEAAEFLQANEAALKDLPVWLFSSGPTGEGDPVEVMQGWRFPEALQPVADRIKPREVAFFMGVIDTDKLNLPEKLLIKAMRAPTGDFRDWDSIDAWASAIAEQLRAKVEH
jgi:menaquinone-dependent protoporphyrinogen oxidase